MLIQYLVSAARVSLRQTLRVAPTFLVPMMLLVACKEESKPAATPAAATTTPASAALGPGEGWLPVRGGRIWYRVSGTGQGTPMVLLHGGPGAGSYYLKPFEDIGDDRPVIRYDQLGAGKSDRLTDTTLMRIPRFVEELDSLRRALKIEKWFVNGHSWGTVLALEYYKAHPKHVAGIVFGGSVFDWRAYARETEAWTKQLTDSSQRAIAAWKQGGSPEAPGFKAATDEFYAKFVWRRPVKADLDDHGRVWQRAVRLHAGGLRIRRHRDPEELRRTGGPSEDQGPGTLDDRRVR
jgi:pimeloyl-ACP methyl ester carboxylesterase